MTHDDVLKQAITLAAAFIANGDIRLGGSTREDSEAMSMTGDLITTLYARISAIDAELLPARERH